MVFWLSLTLTLAILAVALPLGGLELFGAAGAVLLLPHLFIGDLFHWSKFPRLDGGTKVRWLSLALLGLAAFAGIRQAGAYALPLFYLYFFAHFWKDLDLGLGRVDGPCPMEQRLRFPKRWCGALLFSGFLIMASGLITDARLIAQARPIVRAIAAGLLVFGVLRLFQTRTSKRPLDVLWGRYAAFSACFLLLCTVFDVTHPAHSLLPNLVVVWHFMIWYVFYWSLLWRAPAPKTARPLWSLEGIRSSLPALGALVVAVNSLSVLGALCYALSPAGQWLKYVYNYHYLAGCWAIMHVTWDWMPKQIRGIRLAVI